MYIKGAHLPTTAGLSLFIIIINYFYLRVHLSMYVCTYMKDK